MAFVCVDAPPGDHFSIMPPVDAVTRDDLAYMRLHGRNTEGYLNGKSVAERFGWVYGDEELEEIAGRARGLAEQAGEVHVLFNNNRDDDAPTRGAPLPRAARPGPGPAARGRPAQAGLTPAAAARSSRSWRSSPSAERRESPTRARL